MRMRIAILLLILCACSGFSPREAVWEKISHGIYDAEVRKIYIDPTEEKVIYSGTSEALYRSEDGGGTFKVTLRVSGEKRAINDIYVPGVPNGMIYAATDGGLFASRDDGKNWERIYYSSKPGSQRCLSVIRADDTVFLGTEDGLFIRNSQDLQWRQQNGRFSEKPVYRIAQDGRFLYFATGKRLYRFDRQSSDIQRVFSLGHDGRLNEEFDEDEDFGYAGDQFIRSVIIGEATAGTIYIGTTKGVYRSYDFGGNWQPLPVNNLALDELTSLSVQVDPQTDCPDAWWGCLKILAGTRKGAFFLEKEHWMPLYKGMETNVVYDMAENRRGTVYAATARGIFSLSGGKALPFFGNTAGVHEAVPTQTRNTKTHTDRVGRYGFLHEPSVNEVHKLAIHYAEVYPEKIEHWRHLARSKALMPSLSVGLDRAATDLFHWNTGANPDELQKGREFIDWDVSLSWNLSDLVWSTNQTTIDSRSKLMVELREDILNEVTRLYFERRRAQIELAGEEPGSPFILDKELRLAELTALIDALTGGEFSREIEKGSKAAGRQSSVFSGQ